MTLLTKSATIVFYLKIDFVVIVVIDEAAIADIVVDKFNFVMTNMCFIFAAIDTRCITSKLEKTLKIKNKHSIENLNKNYIHQKLDSYEIVKSWNSLFHDHDRAALRNAYINFNKKNICYFFLAFVRNLFSLRKIFFLSKFCLRSSINFYQIFFRLFIVMKKSLNVVNILNMNMFL